MKRKIKASIFGVGMLAIAAASCTSGQQTAETVSGLNPAKFDSTINGKKTALYTLANKNGMEVCITNFGARVVSLVVPDKDGNPTDVVLGYDNIAQYADLENSPSDFGSSVGRYANRINQGKITVDGKEYQLPQNNFGHCLHGGPTGWMYQVYDAEQPNDSTLKFTIVSPDGDNNFPGTVTATTTYTLLSNNTLDITWEATTDKETIINQTNHSYFNLNGGGMVLDHTLMLAAETYLETGPGCLPTGRLLPVAGTPFDFQTVKTIGRDIDTPIEQLKLVNGYDHHFCLSDDRLFHRAAVLRGNISGITMTMDTTSPGVQLYTANSLFRRRGKGGAVYVPRCAVCLEPQFPPDAAHHLELPQPLLQAGSLYRHRTVYTFS